MYIYVCIYVYTIDYQKAFFVAYNFYIGLCIEEPTNIMVTVVAGMCICVCI